MIPDRNQQIEDSCEYSGGCSMGLGLLIIFGFLIANGIQWLWLKHIRWWIKKHKDR